MTDLFCDHEIQYMKGRPISNWRSEKDISISGYSVKVFEGEVQVTCKTYNYSGIVEPHVNDYDKKEYIWSGSLHTWTWK